MGGGGRGGSWRFQYKVTTNLVPNKLLPINFMQFIKVQVVMDQTCSSHEKSQAPGPW